MKIVNRLPCVSPSCNITYSLKEEMYFLTYSNHYLVSLPKLQIEKVEEAKSLIWTMPIAFLSVLYPRTNVFHIDEVEELF